MEELTSGLIRDKTLVFLRLSNNNEKLIKYNNEAINEIFVFCQNVKEEKH